MSALDSDDEEMDWEEIVPPQKPEVSKSETLSSLGPFQITIRAPNQKQSESEARKERSRAEALQRFVRLQTHRLHTISLLCNGSIRNKWINDPLLHARLMSLTPLSLQTSFSMITKRNQPNKQLRGRQFEAAVVRLVKWWSNNFDVNHETGTRHQSYEEAHAESSKTAKGKARATTPRSDSDNEDIGDADRIRSSKSLMKHALVMRGSRDTSAQLFTALCRSLDIPARLVFSLQPVLWRRDKTARSEEAESKIAERRTKQKTRKKQKEEEIVATEAALVASAARDSGSSSRASAAATPLIELDRDDSDVEDTVVIPSAALESSKGKGRASDSFPGTGQTLGGSSDPASIMPLKSRPEIRLRRTRPPGRRLGDSSTNSRRELLLRSSSPPIFWTEVFSRPDGRWLAVDPIRALVDKKRKFEPSSTDKCNHMLYVVAYEEDGYVRDVTPRYAKNFATKIVKERRTGIGKKDWWNDAISFLTRPYRLHRDDVEDAEFDTLQALEGMPSSIGGFKDHPLYALERHLRRDEVIYPKTQIGNFRGEPVYSRSEVVPLKTSENWMRIGRRVKEGNQPLKMVKVRAATLQKKRAIEMAIVDGGEGASADSVQQGLYAEWQTSLYVADPVMDGKVPKNDFGNIDLYVPSMLPEGGVHIPYKSTAKIARQLGIDYAEAVTGFEFKQRRAFPILTGIVIPAEHESELLEVYWKSAQAAEEIERQKKQERVIRHWTRLIQGLRIRQRLNEQYPQNGAQPPSEDVPIHPAGEEAGGFLHELDKNITPYTLPKNLHITLNPIIGSPRSVIPPDDELLLYSYPSTSQNVLDPDDDSNSDMEKVSLSATAKIRRPLKSMTQFAEANKLPTPDVHQGSDDTSPGIVGAPPPRHLFRHSTRSTPKRSVARTTGTKKRRRDKSATESEFDDDDTFEDVPAAPSRPQTRGRQAIVTPSVSVPKTDRVLRSRASKSQGT